MTIQYYPNHLEREGVMPSPLDGADAILTDIELTKNTTAALESVTKMPPGGGNIILNLDPPIRLEDTKFPTDSENGIMSDGSSGANDNNSTYLGSCKNSPAIHDKTLDLSTIIK